MKSVGKQLQEARLAKNWTPELAARETKIKVDRLRDLEADDYNNFSSPTYARGFVRTYARFLGLDEYKILRQLDNKLPDDDSSNIVTDSGVAYVPETSMPPRAAHRNYTGLYVVMGLGGVIALFIAFILFQAYRVGELQGYFAQTSKPEPTVADTASDTNAAPAKPEAGSAARAMPIDSNVAPPVVETSTPDATTNTTVQPVAPVAVAVVASTNAAPTPDAPIQAVKALPVDPTELNQATPATPVAMNTTPPRAQAVSAAELAAADTTPPVTPPAPPPVPTPAISARQSNSGPVVAPLAPPVAPAVSPAPITSLSAADSKKRLVLTASQDSFVRVTALDASDNDKPLFAAVLHSGQQVGFDGRKFSINVGIPSAVAIQLDGVNYGPHSDQEAPETFTVESHQP